MRQGNEKKDGEIHHRDAFAGGEIHHRESCVGAFEGGEIHHRNSCVGAFADAKPVSTFAANAWLRGGRLRKTSRGVVSFAPFLAGISTIALGAMLAFSGNALAGTCTSSGDGATTFTLSCSGAADADSDSTIDFDTGNIFTAGNDGVLRIQDSSDFGLHVASGDAITIDATGNGRSLDIILDGDITAVNGRGFYIENNFGNVASRPSLTLNGDISAGGNSSNPRSLHHAVEVYMPQAPRGMAVVTSGDLFSEEGDGIYFKSGYYVRTGDSSVTSSGTIGTSTTPVGRDGIYAVTYSSDSLSVTSSGDIHATGDGIEAVAKNNAYGAAGNSADTTNVYVTVSRGAVIRGANAVVLGHEGPTPTTGGLTLTLGGSVIATGNAISMTGGASQRLRLHSGFSISGNVVISRNDAILDLGGHRNGTFDLVTDLALFPSGFTTLEKTGSSTWEATSTASRSFDVLNVKEGELLLKGAFASNTTTVTNRGILTIDETVLSGATTLADQAIVTLNGGGSTILGNVTLTDQAILQVVRGDNFVTGDLTTTGGMLRFINILPESTPALTITGAVSGPVIVDLQNSGIIGEDPVALITTVQGSQDGDFVTREGGLHRYSLTFDANTNNWAAQWQGFTPSALAYQNFTAIFTELSRLQSMQQRSGSRAWKGEQGRGLWAKVEGKRSEFDPDTATAISNYEIDEQRIRLGVDVPVSYKALRNASLGANISFGRADSDTADANGSSAIETGLVTVGIGGNWIHRGFYADAQLQYASYESDLSVGGEALLTGIESHAFSMSLEGGYRVPVAGFTLTPQGQITRTDVGFDDFTSDSQETVKLHNGETFAGRIGLALDRDWSDASGAGRVYGSADMRIPLTGETGVNIDGTLLSTELEEPTLDLGFGASYHWRDGATLTGELSTSQGEEKESYRGTLGVRFGF